MQRRGRVVARQLTKQQGSQIDAQAVIEAIETASQWCAEAIAADGLVHLFGTGHSRIPVEEMFPRYGSYPGYNPIVELSMTFHTQVVGANGQRQAMFIERVEGLAEQIFASYDLGPPDAMLVFSAGGLTAVPIDMAIYLNRIVRGATTPTTISSTTPAAPNKWPVMDLVELTASFFACSPRSRFEID